MPLKITGSVKQGKEGVPARVKLLIQDKDGKFKREDESDTGDDGTFEVDILDATGLDRNYKGDTLVGEVMGDKRFRRVEKLIPGTEVEVLFFVNDWCKELRQRMMGAPLLSRDTLGRISEAEDALQQAMIVAVLACVAFGAILGASGGLVGAIFAGLLVLVLWALSVALTYWIGTTVLAGQDTDTTFTKYLRPVGFAATPLLAAAIILTVLFVLDASSSLLNLLFLAGLLWEILALAAAGRLALGYGKQWWRAFLVVLLPPAVALAIFWWVALR